MAAAATRRQQRQQRLCAALVDAEQQARAAVRADFEALVAAAVPRLDAAGSFASFAAAWRLLGMEAVHLATRPEDHERALVRRRRRWRTRGWGWVCCG
jgi:hypothetical protein